MSMGHQKCYEVQLVIFHIKYTITHSLHIKIQPIIIALKVSKKKNSLRGNL